MRDVEITLRVCGGNARNKPMGIGKGMRRCETESSQKKKKKTSYMVIDVVKRFGQLLLSFC